MAKNHVMHYSKDNQIMKNRTELGVPRGQEGYNIDDKYIHSFINFVRESITNHLQMKNELKLLKGRVEILSMEIERLKNKVR